MSVRYIVFIASRTMIYNEIQDRVLGKGGYEKISILTSLPHVKLSARNRLQV
jgi:hypothetical protein